MVYLDKLVPKYVINISTMQHKQEIRGKRIYTRRINFITWSVMFLQLTDLCRAIQKQCTSDVDEQSDRTYEQCDSYPRDHTSYLTAISNQEKNAKRKKERTG